MKRSYKGIVSGFFTAFLLSVILIFGLFAERYRQVFLDGVSLWAVCVLPSSLPFLFLTALLTKTGGVEKLSRIFAPFTKALFCLSGVSGYCLLLSFLCGYPVGAKTLADLKETGAIDKAQATKMSVLCSTSGPLFILGSVGGGMFQNPKIGFILLFSHFSAVLLSGMGMRFYKKSAFFATQIPLPKTENILYESMYSSVLSALCVGGFVSVFYTFAVMLADFGVFAPAGVLFTLFGSSAKSGEAFARGLVEMTGGCSYLASSPTVFNIALCAFLITFGGISILFQQICYLKKADVNLAFFSVVKLLQAILAALLAWCLCLLFL
jgi:sporulation integral membrane protein YlbJ